MGGTRSWSPVGRGEDGDARRVRSLANWASVALLALGSGSVFGQPLEVTGSVETPQREPLAGARVELHALLTHEVLARAAVEGVELEPLRSARTGADGRYAVAAPEPGMYSLVFRAEGRMPRLLSLEPLFETVELNRVELPPSRRVAVTVRDPEGSPVGGARVMLRDDPGPVMLGRGRELVRSLASFQATDENGVARFEVGRDDEWRVSVTSAGFAPIRTEKQIEDSLSVTLSAGRRLSLKVVREGGAAVAGALLLDESSDLPLGLTGEDGALAIVAPGDRPLSLRAVDAGPGTGFARLEPSTGASVETTEIVLESLTLAGSVVSAGDRKPFAGAWVWDSDSPRGWVQTDAEGRYRLPASPVRSGGPRLVASAPTAFQETTQADPSLVARGEGPTFALRLAARLVGEVVDAAGRPVPDAEVSRQGSGRGISFGETRRPSHTGADGSFVISRIGAGEPSTLRVRAAGHSPKSVEVEALEAGAQRRITVTLDAGRRALGTVVDLSDVPVAGARVTLTESIAGGADFEAILERQIAGGEALLEATTDVEGRFAIVDLAPGRYDLEAQAPGFAPAHVPAVEVTRESKDTEIGIVALSPGVAVEGIVRDPAGAPLEGAEIRKQVDRGRFRVVGVGTMQSGIPADATTDAQGRFRLEDLAEGSTLSVTAELRGYGAVSLEGVRAPTEEPLDIVLQPASTLRGVVVDALGEGVPQALVRLSGEMGGAGNVVTMVRRSMRSERADEEGRFELADVVPGRYELRATGSGFQEGRQGGIEVVAGRDPSEVRLVLEKGAVLRGQVLAEDGLPVLGARVQRVQQRSGPLAFPGFSIGARTDADGRYRLDGLPLGSTSIAVDHDKHPKQVRDFVVQEGENLLDFRLESGREIAGRVIDETGLPVAGATVAARPPAGGFTVSLGAQNADPVTDARGEFTIEGLADGDYRVTARKSGYAEASTEDLVRVDGSSVYGMELRLAVGAAIVGRVLGLEFDDLSRVQVIALQPGTGVNPTLGQVDYEGNYRLENVASGDWMVMASVGRAGRSARGTVTVEPGAAEVLLDLEFGGGLAIRGQVLRDGEPVPGSMVVASGRTTTSNAQATTDQEGRFVLEGLESDTYRLIVANLGSGASHEEEVELAGADTDVLVELRESGIAGRVIDARDGTGVAGARLSLTPVGDDQDRLGLVGFGTPPESGLGGAFRLGGVSAGTWLVRADKDGYATGTAQVEVTEGLDLEGVELELEPAQGLTLIVATATGRPADEVAVVALDGADRVVLQRQVTAGEGGVVRLDELPAGTWTLLVAPSSGGVTASRTVTAPGEDVVVRFPDAGSLRVTVPELEGSGLQARLRLLDPEGRPYRSAQFFQVTSEWTVRDGLIQLPLIPVGTWTLEVTTPDGTRSWSEVARVVPGTTLDVIVP